MSKPRLLWISDATTHTGFARVAHSVLPHLMGEYEVNVLGAFFNGDPDHGYPYPIWPAASPSEPFGYGRLPEVAKKFKPDVVMVLNDSYYVSKFVQLREKRKAEWKLCAYMPMDGPNIHAEVAKRLSSLDAAVFYTHFGLKVAQAAGFEGNAAIIPHGIDRRVFRPMSRDAARESLGLSPEHFIIANVNRNQPRKRLDLTIAYFADWVQRENLPSNVKLYLHCAAKDSHLNGVEELAAYFGVRDRLILTAPDLRWDRGVEEGRLSAVYSAQDLAVSTTLGEGWGLTTMEGMACGVPQLVPEWSGLAEWARGAVEYVPCSEIQVFSGLENRVGGVADREAFIAGVSRLYRDQGRREELRQDGLELVSRPEFEWSNVARAFAGVLGSVLTGERTEVAA